MLLSKHMTGVVRDDSSWVLCAFVYSPPTPPPRGPTWRGKQFKQKHQIAGAFIRCMLVETLSSKPPGEGVTSQFGNAHARGLLNMNSRLIMALLHMPVGRKRAGISLANAEVLFEIWAMPMRGNSVNLRTQRNEMIGYSSSLA